MHVKRGAAGSADLLGRLVDLTIAEASASRAGSEAIWLRLSELMFVEVVRRYLGTLPEGRRGWLAALRDPSIGTVLSMLHARPAHSWTLAELAREAGISRAVLAERFANIVGLPPMQYLTLWRMQIAARLLSDEPVKVAEAGRAIGYESEAAFSRAFKKATGLSPSAWRRQTVSGQL